MSENNNNMQPIDHIRSIEYLCQLFPTKTAEQIIQLHEQDKKGHELYQRQQNQKKLQRIEDLTKNPFRKLVHVGSNGFMNMTYLHCTKVELIENEIYFDCEKTTLIKSDSRGYSVEQRTTSMQSHHAYFSCISPENHHMLTEEQYKQIFKKLENLFT